MAITKNNVLIPPIQKLRPSWGSTVTHIAVYLLRHAFLSTLAAVFIVQPLYHKLILQNSHLRTLSEPALFVLVFAGFCHCVPWIIINTVFLLFDSLHPIYGSGLLKSSPLLAPLGRQMAKYKLPRQPQQLPSSELIRKTFLEGFFIQILLTPMALYFGVVYSGACMLRAPPPETVIAGFSQDDWKDYTLLQYFPLMLMRIAALMPHFILANICNELGFYVAHGALHSNSTIYRLIHKKHHMYTGPMGFAAEYTTLPEEILANVIPTVSYFSFMFFFYTREDAMKSDFVRSARAWPLMMAWVWARLWETYECHSGYCFSDTWLGKLGLMHGHRARFHDFHHTHNVSNYGTGIFMDALLNTMDPYLVYRYPQKNPPTMTPEEERERAQRDLHAASAAMQHVLLKS